MYMLELMDYRIVSSLDPSNSYDFVHNSKSSGLSDKIGRSYKLEKLEMVHY